MLLLTASTPSTSSSIQVSKQFSTALTDHRIDKPTVDGGLGERRERKSGICHNIPRSEFPTAIRSFNGF